MESAVRKGKVSRGGVGAVGLLAVVLVTPVVQPAILVGVPLLLLLATDGARRPLALGVAVLTLLVASTGIRDGFWYVDRAWALLVGGWFLGLTMLAPGWSHASRALAAVAGAGLVGALTLTLRSGAWTTINAAVAAGVAATVEITVAQLRAQPNANAATDWFIQGLRRAPELSGSYFVALVALESVAALGLAWWARARLVGGAGLGRMRDFRFNDHLVWVLVAGLVFLFMQGAWARVGSNAVLFMGAMYTLRGSAVVLFLSGGLSLFGWIFLFLALLWTAPLLVTLAVLIGIGDTWLDLRSRFRTEPV